MIPPFSQCSCVRKQSHPPASSGWVDGLSYAVMPQTAPSRHSFRPPKIPLQRLMDATGSTEFFHSSRLAMHDQSVGHQVQRNRSLHAATVYRSLGHAVDDTGSFVLRHGHGTGGAHGAEAVGTILTHTGHDDADGVVAPLVGD